MSAMTFESIHLSPRRAAVRRKHRPDSPVVAVEKQPTTIAGIRTESNSAGSRYKIGLIALTGISVALHAIILIAINDHEPGNTAAKPKMLPLTIEMAPQPQQKVAPPQPLIQPKSLPQVAKPIAAPVRRAIAPAPALPVVSNTTPVDTTAPSQDTVQVATTPAPEPTPVERVTEPRGYAGYLHNPAPNYPAAAQKRGLQGQVVLKVHVLANGQPDDISIAKSSGHGSLDDAAIKAVTAWAFEPAKRGQTPIDGWVKVPLNFKLDT